MAEALPCDFDVWLRDTLVSLNIDDEVFSPYIKSIVEGEENKDEKVEAIQGILEGLTETSIDSLCDDILNKWNLCSEEQVKIVETKEKVDFEDKIAKIMVQQAQQSVVVNKPRSKEEDSLKSAILANYAEVSDGEEDEEGGGGGGGGGGGEESSFGVRNMNTEEVLKAEREKREKTKEESQRKKEKDKEDRAKQKAKDDERKDKEKKRTQKGERRR